MQNFTKCMRHIYAYIHILYYILYIIYIVYIMYVQNMIAWIVYLSIISCRRLALDNVIVVTIGAMTECNFHMTLMDVKTVLLDGSQEAYAEFVGSESVRLIVSMHVPADRLFTICNDVHREECIRVSTYDRRQIMARFPRFFLFSPNHLVCIRSVISIYDMACSELNSTSYFPKVYLFKVFENY